MSKQCISAVQDFHLHDVSSINVLRRWVLHKQKGWEEVGGCTQRLQAAWPWRFLALWRPWLALDGLLLSSYAQSGPIDSFRSLDRQTLAMSADFQGLVNEGVWLAGSALVQFFWCLNPQHNWKCSTFMVGPMGMRGFRGGPLTFQLVYSVHGSMFLQWCWLRRVVLDLFEKTVALGLTTSMAVINAC